MALFDNLRQQKQKQREDDEQTYWHFMATLDIAKPTPADQQRLNALLQATGRTVEQCEADHRVILDALDHRRFMRDNGDHIANRDTATVAKDAAFAERQKTFARINELVRQAIENEQTAEAIQGQFYDHRRALNELEKANPAAFAAVSTVKI